MFVSYARADRERVRPLIDALKSRFNVFSDENIPPGALWRQVLTEQLDAARCVLVVWTKASVGSKFVWSEVDHAIKRGIVVPVRLDPDAKIPLGHDQENYVDVPLGSDGTDKALRIVFGRIRELLARPAYVPMGPSLTEDTWALKRSLRATDRLAKLSDRVQTLQGVLVRGDGPVKDVTGTLEQIHRTYGSVTGAIERFLAPAGRRGTISAKPYLAMERGALVREIENKRGHCSRITEYYVRDGGLREWLKPRLRAPQLKTLDATFRQLSTADGGLFEDLTRIGNAMTEEARGIASLLLSGQQQRARKRILQGRKRLHPLERRLSSAMSTLQKIESSLGYVPRARQGRA